MDVLKEKQPSRRPYLLPPPSSLPSSKNPSLSWSNPTSLFNFSFFFKLTLTMVAIPSILLGSAVLQALGPMIDPLQQAAKGSHKNVNGGSTGTVQNHGIAQNNTAPAVNTTAPQVNTTSNQFATIAGPVVSTNFPDPAIIQVGNTYYSFATSNKWSNDTIHIQVATSTDYTTWTVLNQDALPVPGAWSDGNRVWAPDVVQVVSGYFVKREGKIIR